VNQTHASTGAPVKLKREILPVAVPMDTGVNCVKKEVRDHIVRDLEFHKTEQTLHFILEIFISYRLW